MKTIVLDHGIYGKKEYAVKHPTRGLGIITIEGCGSTYRIIHLSSAMSVWNGLDSNSMAIAKERMARLAKLGDWTGVGPLLFGALPVEQIHACR